VEYNEIMFNKEPVPVAARSKA